MAEAQWIHKLPGEVVRERVTELCRLSAGKRVANIGFADVGLAKMKQARGSWLHQRLYEVTSQLIGLDLSKEDVDAALEMGFECYAVDCQRRGATAELGIKAEVIVAGEIIEHLEATGVFLDEMHDLLEPGGCLVLTTPNPSWLTGFLAALAGREVINPDHVGWHSPTTLTTLLSRHGWRVERACYYVPDPLPALGNPSRGARLKLAAFNAYRAVCRVICRLRPGLSDGFILVCSPDTPFNP